MKGATADRTVAWMGAVNGALTRHGRKFTSTQRRRGFADFMDLSQGLRRTASDSSEARGVLSAKLAALPSTVPVPPQTVVNVQLKDSSTKSVFKMHAYLKDGALQFAPGAQQNASGVVKMSIGTALEFCSSTAPDYLLQAFAQGQIVLSGDLEAIEVLRGALDDSLPGSSLRSALRSATRKWLG